MSFFLAVFYALFDLNRPNQRRIVDV